jgi:biotin-(acetyl-CoA carboxylase) ligase
MSNTLFVGKVYHCFDELPSTNDWAAQIIAYHTPNVGEIGHTKGPAKTKPPEGTVVRAANQTAGRGQLGSQWHSSPGENLLLSIIFYPTWLEAQAQFYLSMAVALGVRDVILSLGHSSLGHSSLGHSSLGHSLLGHSSLGHSSLGHSSLGHSSLGHSPSEHRVPSTVHRIPSTVHRAPLTAIKWPNDLYLEDKKTAGILIQNAISGPNLQSSIVGIGLNVNQLEFSPDLPNATSLALAFGQKLDVDAVADQLFECLERRYLQLKAGHRAAIKSEYEAQLWRRGESSRFVRTADGSVFEGVVLGVSERGLLRVETGSMVEEFDLKQVTIST